MKKCPFCAEEIQDAAIVCKHCHRDLVAAPAGNLPAGIALSDPAPTPPAVVAPKKTSPTTWGCLTVIILFVLAVGWCSSNIPDRSRTPGTSTSTSVPPGTATPPPPAKPPLALLSARGYDEHGFHIVEGQVRNISNAPLKNVTAVATWYDKGDGFITTADALIEYNPILPGQTSPFKTMTTTNPAMSKYSVAFKELMGGQIEVEDRRKK